MKVTDHQFATASELMDAIIQVAVQAKIYTDEGSLEEASRRLGYIVEHAQFGQLMLEGWSK